MHWIKPVQGGCVSVFGARYVGLSRIIAARTSSLWPPYGIGQAIIFLPCDLYLLLLFFSSPHLSGQKLDVYHTSTHGVALVRI